MKLIKKFRAELMLFVAPFNDETADVPILENIRSPIPENVYVPIPRNIRSPIPENADIPISENNDIS